jgi:DNA polymerase-3 subunit epsilon
MNFVALDFETADAGRDSACALALVRVEGDRVVARESRLLRPPRPEVLFSWIHGITWEQVEGEPSFEEAWPSMAPLLDGADFLAAHNAGFDRAVLGACCDRAGFERPPLPFLCTVRLARRVWDVRPTRLPDVCGYLGIPLEHHRAASDAEACASIVIRALREAGPAAVEEGLGGRRRARAISTTTGGRRPGRPSPPR